MRSIRGLPYALWQEETFSLISLSLHHPIQVSALVPKPEIAINTFLLTIQC
jgi:hypothetical protein